jgi:hypothetical protein
MVVWLRQHEKNACPLSVRRRKYENILDINVSINNNNNNNNNKSAPESILLEI